MLPTLLNHSGVSRIFKQFPQTSRLLNYSKNLANYSKNLLNYSKNLPKVTYNGKNPTFTVIFSIQVPSKWHENSYFNVYFWHFLQGACPWTPLVGLRGWRRSQFRNLVEVEIPAGWQHCHTELYVNSLELSWLLEINYTKTFKHFHEKTFLKISPTHRKVLPHRYRVWSRRLRFEWDFLPPGGCAIITLGGVVA